MRTLFSFILLFAVTFVYGQNKPCYTDEANSKFAEKSDYYGTYREKLEGLIQQRMAKSVSYGESVITIPVVVHVVYNTPQQNISDQQIFSQMDVLNADYRLQNTDLNKIRPVFQGYEGDVRVEFCLAQRDPQGNATTGIIRTNSSVTDWGCDDSVKFTANGGSDAWPCDQYLNIWVCNLNCANGYAYYPGIPDEYDGVVIHTYVFGTTGYVFSGAHGRTTTHEIGHWLNLYHPFYDGCLGNDPQTCEILGDRVCDTPSDTITWDCATTNSCVDYPIDLPDQWENYMNYTEDSCRVMFTNGQVERMRAALYLARPTILTSPGCIPPGTNYYDAAIANLISPTNAQCHQYIEPEIRIGSGCTMPMTSAVFNYKVDNGSWQSYTWNGTLNNSQFVNIILPQAAALPGSHTMTVVASLPNGQGDMNPNNDTLIFTFEIIDHGYSYVQFGPALMEDFELTSFPPAGWSFDDLSESIHWIRSSQASSYGNGSGSAMYDNFSLSDEGRKSSLYTLYLTFDVTTCGCTYHYMNFDWAYPLPSPPGTFFADTLTISFSTDCGDTWTQLWEKGGNDLATAPFYSYTTPFTPLPTEWQTNTVDLTPAVLNPLVIIKFENTNDWGNRLFLDNINFYYVSTITETGLSYKVSLFPSPLSSDQNLFVSVDPAEGVELIISDLSGRTVLVGKPNTELSVNTLAKGMYVVRGVAGKKPLFQRKFIVK